MIARGIFALAAVAVGCASLAGCEADARNDATLFLDRVERIDTDDPVVERERIVDSLAVLPLAAPEVRTARRSCVEAHRAILAAEIHNDWVRRAIDEVDGEEARLTPHQRAKIERHLVDSTRNLDRSRPALAECHRRTNDLRVRYGSGRVQSLDD